MLKTGLRASLENCLASNYPRKAQVPTTKLKTEITSEP